MKIHKDHLIIHSKREAVTAKMKDESVDLVVSDPPFGVRREEWDDKEMFIKNVCGWLSEDLRITKHAVIWFCAGKMIPYIFNDLVMYRQHDLFHRLHTWEKPQGTQFAGASNNNIWYSIEPILVFSKNRDKTKSYGKDMPYGYDNFSYRTIPQNVTGHPTSKPVSLIRKLIGYYSNPNELIFDGFGGSFSTTIAAIDMGRRSIVVEQLPFIDKPITDRNGDNPDYFGNGVERIQKHLDAPKMFVGASDENTEIYNETMDMFNDNK